jgi:hypothetical protein
MNHKLMLALALLSEIFLYEICEDFFVNRSTNVNVEKNPSFVTAALKCIMSADCHHEESTFSKYNDTSVKSMRHFPRWSDGIVIDELVEAIRFTLDGKIKRDRADKVYILDTSGLKFAVPNNTLDKIVLRRANRTEDLARYALKKLMANNMTNMRIQYPYLASAIAKAGFAYIANHADSMFCSSRPIIDGHKNQISNATVPIFTLSSPVDCPTTFPIPTYEAIQYAEMSWKKLIPAYNNAYPWQSKISMAVWRGKPTGHKLANNSRLHLCELSRKRPDLLDAKIVQTIDGSPYGLFHESIYVGSRMKMEHFQHYKAIVDIDGHSWSSRFTALLCFSSVVIKVEPGHVDHFHPSLIPWKHYIPVSSDMSDLYEAVEYATSDDHREAVSQMISRANKWCAEHLQMDLLADDLLRTWNVYTKHLYQADSDWSSKWLLARGAILNEYEFR